MKLGYARVSTTDQDLAIQRVRLHEVEVAPFQWTVYGLGFMQLPGRSSRSP